MVSCKVFTSFSPHPVKQDFIALISIKKILIYNSHKETKIKTLKNSSTTVTDRMDQKKQKQNLEPQAKTWAKMSKKPPTILEVKGKKSTSPNFRRSTQRLAAQKSIICYSSGVYSGVNGLAVHAYAALGADTMLRSDQITPMLRASLWLGPECGPAPKFRGSAAVPDCVKNCLHGA